MPTSRAMRIPIQRLRCSSPSPLHKAHADDHVCFVPAAQPLGTSFTVSATASSGLAVTFTSQTPATCSTSGTNGATISTLALGTCTLPRQPGGQCQLPSGFAGDPKPRLRKPAAQWCLHRPRILPRMGTDHPERHGYRRQSDWHGDIQRGDVQWPGCAVQRGFAGVGPGGAVPARLTNHHRSITPLPYGGDANNTPITVAAQVIVSLGRLSLSATATPLAPQAGQPLTLRAALSGTALHRHHGLLRKRCDTARLCRRGAALLPGGTDTAIAGFAR